MLRCHREGRAPARESEYIFRVTYLITQGRGADCQASHLEKNFWVAGAKDRVIESDHQGERGEVGEEATLAGSVSAARQPALPLPCVHLNWNTPWDSIVVGFSWPRTHNTPFSSSHVSPSPSKQAHFLVEYFSLWSSGSSFPGLSP